MAICPHCGRTVPDDALICPYCGAQISEDIAVCGNCGHIIPVDAKVCPYCGVELSDKVICPNCGKEIPADSKSCPYCGYRFDKDHLPVRSAAVGYVPFSSSESSKPPRKPKKEKSGFWKGFTVGFIVALLLGMAFVGYFYVLPLQKENKDLKLQLQDLQESYNSLSMKYDALVMNYTALNQSYLEKVQNYNSLLARYIDLQSNYTTLYGSFKNLTDFGDEKFIVLLFFTTDYGANKYWLYLEIDPALYLHYKSLPHLPGNSLYTDEFKNYVVTDDVMEEIVDSVKSKLVSTSDEELADALLSLVQNKNNVHNVDGPGIYEDLNGTNLGTYYHIDEYAKYPLEMLILRNGECLDDSIFYLSLIKTAGLHGGFAFYMLSNGGHVEPWINLTSGHPTHTHNGSYCYREINGSWYYPAETTAYGWRVGELPDELKGLDFEFVRAS